MPDFSPAYIPAGSLKTVHTGAGTVSQMIASHGQASAQTVILYDGVDASGTVLGRFVLPANCEPQRFHFNRPEIRFSTGLTVQPANCEVLLFGTGGR